MSIKTLVQKATHQVVKHSPALLVGAGVVGLVGTVYLTYKAAPKLEKKIEEVRKAEEEEPGSTNRKETAIHILKIAGPPVGAGLATIGCFLMAHRIQAGRISALSGAFTLLSTNYTEMKDKFIAEYGVEKFREFFGHSVKEEIISTNDKGKEIKTIEELQREGINPLDGMWFSASSEYTADDHDYNLAWVQSKIAKLELRIFQRGTLMMNEVFDELGMDRTRIGALLGWNVSAGFGVDVSYIYNEAINGREPQIYIRWNTPEYVYNDVEFDGRYGLFERPF